MTMIEKLCRQFASDMHDNPDNWRRYIPNIDHYLGILTGPTLVEVDNALPAIQEFIPDKKQAEAAIVSVNSQLLLGYRQGI